MRGSLIISLWYPKAQLSIEVGIGRRHHFGETGVDVVDFIADSLGCYDWHIADDLEKSVVPVPAQRWNSVITARQVAQMYRARLVIQERWRLHCGVIADLRRGRRCIAWTKRKREQPEQGE